MSLTSHNKVVNCKTLRIEEGRLLDVTQLNSPHHTVRGESDNISLLVIHNISLPAGQFSHNYITDLFMGTLNCDAHPSFCDLKNLRVSAHCLIRRDGEIIQYVSFNDKAWHAGVSQFKGREQCNDFSIGIELEGTDDLAYNEIQYQQLAIITKGIMATYPAICLDNIVGHCDIAPGRKTDPGSAFNWQYFRQLLV